ncbi:MAG: PHP domain-containing protein [Parabacteroides sp.]|nr:PHP domain-containing protein [Parabacteroides sp.]
MASFKRLKKNIDCLTFAVIENKYDLRVNVSSTLGKLLLVIAVALFSVPTAMSQLVQAPTKTKTFILLNHLPLQRTEIILPKVNGYTLYKGDFHVHTIYSDGDVTPRERIREAWYDGLDVIAITDHLEIRTYEKFMLKALQAYSKDGKPFVYAHAGIANKKNQDAPVLSNLNAGYEEALDMIDREGFPITVIRGTEIWREPSETGEYNALFLKDINAICHKDLFESFRRVKEQGGIIMHNHPGWRRETMEKSKDQIRAYAEGWVDGVEVINDVYLYPEMIDRCVDEKLTIFSNTDIHRTSALYFPRGAHFFRTMTFIMAKDRSEEAIKEALLDRRTIGYSYNNLVGEEKYLLEFLNEAVECRIVDVNEKTDTRMYQLTNHCSVPFVLRMGVSSVPLNPFQSVCVSFGRDKETGEYEEPTFVVENMWTVGDNNPKMTIKIDK